MDLIVVTQPPEIKFGLLTSKLLETWQMFVVSQGFAVLSF